MITRELPRAAITAIVLALFAFAYISDADDEMMKGALIAAFSSAIAYWLGSSKGSADKTEMLENRPTGQPNDPVTVTEE